MLGATRRGGAGPALGPRTHWPALCECGPGRPAAGGLCKGRRGCQDTGHCGGAGEGPGQGPQGRWRCVTVSLVSCSRSGCCMATRTVCGELSSAPQLSSAGDGSVILWK